MSVSAVRLTCLPRSHDHLPSTVVWNAGGISQWGAIDE